VARTSFSVDVQKFVEKIPVNATYVYKKIALDMYTRIAQRTRVDTGYCRGNWQVGVGHMPTGVVNKRFDTASALSELSQFDAAREQDIFIVNHVHYAPYLEFGTETRSGDHMVGRTVAEFHEFVRKAIRGL
jgi:hypothetical protein